ncbi:hypothetical protein DCAR_0104367 [Daucus carota subsp. sativus]|uniref:Uncharacterized protein n=1 Tax=Daucus carota subsp. sativus TaxID=79200 RepID=A0A162B8T0_DAUCS|nr:hypothetical protein DCAR_0104367 [Daucus carota subsp. sativus]
MQSGQVRLKRIDLAENRSSEEYTNPLSWHYVDIMLNVTRIVPYLYNAGEDNYGVEDGVVKATLYSLIVEPIPL